MRSILAGVLSLLCFCFPALAENSPIRIGWIGAMSGPFAKIGAYQSALLAQDDINAAGGIRGRKLDLVFEDGKGEGKAAASAAQKLIGVDGVKYIVGGHCSPETLAIAPIAERSKTVLLAAVTSNPKLTTAGDYIFRLTAVSTKHADLEVPFAMKQLGLKRFAIVHEETDYARPPAERFAELVKQNGGEVLDFQSYNPGETDFRSVLTRIRGEKPDGIYIGVQVPDAAVLILQQAHDLGLSAPFFGNEIAGNAATVDAGKTELFEGLVFGEPTFDLERPITKQFVDHYKQRFGVAGLPYGFWSAEAYDAVRVMAKAINDCGETADDVKRCLYQVRDYPGVSAPVSIDQNGDGLRQYVLKRVTGGKVVTISKG